MSIRKTLLVAFLSIVLLFALNLAVYIWGDVKRTNTITDLLNGIERQELLVAIRHDLEDLHKKTSLLILAYSSTTGAENSTDDFNDLNQQATNIHEKIKKIRKLLPQTEIARIANFEVAFIALVDSWRKFYFHFGRDHSKSLIEWSVNTEPLNSKLIQILLPELEGREKQLKQESRQKYADVSSLVVSITVTIFMVSILFSILIAIILVSKIKNGLTRLTVGANRIGKGKLGERISIQGKDELAELAISFNEMAEHLESAKQQQQTYQKKIEEEHQEAQQQKDRAENLLLNILPKSVASELQLRGKVNPQYFEEATILFADIKGFTELSAKLAADQLVYKLHQYFSAFDKITEQYHIEKLKTIGDCYMCAAGIPERSPSHPVDMVFAAMEMINCVETFRQEDQLDWDVRIGIHTGAVICGVVGFRKFAFDVWGETVNFASRLESAGETGKINISNSTRERIKDFFYCNARGDIAIKEGTKFPMFFVEGIHPDLLECDENNVPIGLKNRYQVYFEKELMPLPGFMLQHSGNELSG